MGGAVQIEGFSKENIQECSELFLKSKEKSEAMIEQAMKITCSSNKVTHIFGNWEFQPMGYYELLRIPIILLLTCVVNNEKNRLPTTQTELYETVFDILIARTALKTFTPGMHADNKDFTEALMFGLDCLMVSSAERDWETSLGESKYRFT